MNRVDTRGGRPLPEPAQERGDSGRLTRGNDLDPAIGEVLGPAIERKAHGFVGRRGAVVNPLHAPGDEAAYRLSRARAQSSSALRC